MSNPLRKKRSCSEHITQQKMALDPRFERHVTVEEQSEESRRRANAIQKKTYTNWISKVHHLHIDDLYTDLRDGKLLLQLLETVSGEKIPYRRGKSMRESEMFEGLGRIQLALDFLRKQNVRLENIHASEIQEGNEKQTLALIWAIILGYQIVVISRDDPYPVEPPHTPNGPPLEADPQQDEKSQVSVAEPKEQNATRALLQWCQKTTQGYPGVKVTDFTTSWKNGLAFNAIIHKHRADLIDFDSLEPENTVDNLNNAFDVAEKELGIPKLLDTEDMVCPDQRSIVVYISLYYSYFFLEHHKTAVVSEQLSEDVSEVSRQKVEQVVALPASDTATESEQLSEDVSEVSRQKVEPVVAVPASDTATESEQLSEDVSEVSRQKVEPVVAVPACDTATEPSVVTTQAGLNSASSLASSRSETETTQISTQKDLSASPHPPQSSPPSHPPRPDPPQQYPPQPDPPQQYPPQPDPPQQYPPQPSAPQQYTPQPSVPQQYPPQPDPSQQYPPQPDPSTPPYPPPSYYAQYPNYYQPYHQYPYQQQPYYQQPYTPPYQPQPYTPPYNPQPSYYTPPMQMQQQSLIQVQTGLGMLTVGGQQGLGAGANQSSFVKLGSTAIGAAPCSQPVKAASSAPTKKKGKKKKVK